MKIKTYRAKSIQQALKQVRDEFGPDASVLHTCEVRPGLLKRLFGVREVEVTAANDVNVPSRFAPSDCGMQLEQTQETDSRRYSTSCPAHQIPPAHEQDFRLKFREEIKGQLSDLQSKIGELCRQRERVEELPESLFHLFTNLIDAEIDEDVARELIGRARSQSSPGELDDPALLKDRIAGLIQSEIRVSGPIEIIPGKRRLVSLIGPTGVGKTTTIAKLAANFHLREKRKVGLITVDTYRIAAVEQLRTYAEIIDLPMEVVSTPREMREAVARLSNLDLILMDTAGRSPHDEVRIQELKSMIGEAAADEVHLVLSSATGTASLKKAARRFQSAGATSLLLTKLDEATGLGNLLPLIRECDLPLSYVTNGQNVPDDIQTARANRLSRLILAIDRDEEKIH